MHLLGLRSFRLRSVSLSVAAAAAAFFASGAVAQSAPFVLPYTMSTYVGPHATYVPGATCGANGALALDAPGDGCIVFSIPFTATESTTATLTNVSSTAGLFIGQSVSGPGIPANASIVGISGSTITLSAPALATGTNVSLTAAAGSVGVDPHDIRVDPQGNVFWLDDNGSTSVIHKILANSGRMIAYAGSVVNTKGSCSSAQDIGGDGCVSTDGGGNVTASSFTAKIPKSRGIAVGANGDVYYADYNGNADHRIAAATNLAQLVAGNPSTTAAGTSGLQDAAPPTKSLVSASRGIGVDAAGNVYIADTGNNVIRLAVPVTGGYSTFTVTKPNGAAGSGSAGCVNTSDGTTSGTKVITTGLPANQSQVCAPEDVQIDSNGNIIIADAGDNFLRGIYSGKGPFFGIANPQAGYLYNLAGALPAVNTYPKDGTTPTFPGTNIVISLRKISVDSRNNVYIADSGSNVVWFLDNATGNIRILAGSYGLTGGGSYCVNANPTASPVGDGCPASTASMISSSDMATAADNQGNVYITDAQGAIGANARLRKVLSGLNFPSVTSGATVTQTLEIHFAPVDTPAAANAFTLSGTPGTNIDYSLGTPACTLETDTTTDCKVPVIFTPTKAGYDTATLTIHSTLGGVNSYLLTGTGIASAVAIDPGSVSIASAGVNNSQGIAVDGAGNIYTADTGSNRILFTATGGGATTVFAGTGAAGNTGDNGLATAATLSGPRAVAVDTSGNVFIADTGNNRIRRVNTSTGIITNYAGAGAVCATASDAFGDGCAGTAATLNAPSGLVADNLGNLFVADTGNNLIREIGNNGYISFLAGGAANPNTTNDSFGDGFPANQVIFNSPRGLAYDSVGKNLIIADTGDNVVRSIFLGNSINGTNTTYTVLTNPVNRVAGVQSGTAGSVTDSGSTALGSYLSAPTGVAVDPSGSIYIADSGNSAIRLVSTNGTISTLIGSLGTAGTGTVPGTAANAQLNAPAGVAVLNNGTLEIADSGNNRLLTDQRAQITYQFGRTNIGFPSPVQNFIETNVGNATVTLPSPLLTNTPPQTQFTLVPASGAAGCVPGPFVSGATCMLQGQFNPASTGNFTTTFTEVGTNAGTGDPSLTFTGTGAVLTPTTGTVAQTFPSTGSAQFGGQFTVTATITPQSCNAAAPSCAPTGTVRFIVDGGNPGSPVNLAPNATATASTASQNITGLAVGAHTISCRYSGDGFYASDTCVIANISITPASTTSLLSATNNNAPQFLANNCMVDPSDKTKTLCTVSTLTATVVSSGTAGTAIGNVTFTATGGPLGTTVQTLGSSSTNAAGQAVYYLQYQIDANKNLTYDHTLLPGTYQLGCTFTSTSPNFSTSSCTPITFTVAPQAVDFSLQIYPCGAPTLIAAGFINPTVGVLCNSPLPLVNGAPQVATAQGSTADATIFITADNTVSGKLTFSCSGLPVNSICTFQPTSLTLSASTGFNAPQAVDMTLWTDILPGNATSSLHAPGDIQHLGRAHDGVSLAALLGWPATLLGFVAMLRFRRRAGHLRGLALLGLLLSVFGATAAMTGCGSGGPGAYQPALTPAGTYPITVTVTGDGITHTAVVYWKVTAPGFPGQE